ncbi:polycystin-1-like protein 1 [Sorex fumeus]|uniref:polycystin-1-like protein 1 n=1 Tax=Sorex fumeus TaxID=62283 RepID=UPI0024AE3950|nr:polycystin-1-like protein 1 [Sorex fumeus]
MRASCLGVRWRVLIHFMPLLCMVQPTPRISSKEDLSASWPDDCSGSPQHTPAETLVPGMGESSEDSFGGQNRCVQASCSMSSLSGMTAMTKSRTLQLCICSRSPAKKVQVGKALEETPASDHDVTPKPEIRVNLMQPVSAEKLGFPPCVLTATEEAVELESPPVLASWKKVFLTATALPPGHRAHMFEPKKALNGSNTLKTTSGTMSKVNGKTVAHSDWGIHVGCLPLGAVNIHSLSESQPGLREPCPCTDCHHGAVPIHDHAVTIESAIHGYPETDVWAPKNLGFRLHIASKAACCVVMDFGDSSGVQMRIHNMPEEMAVTTYHWYRKEGIYMLKTVIYNECYGTEIELGPYYVKIGHETISVFMNSSSVHANEVLIFAGSTLDEKYSVIMHQFPSISSYNVSFASPIQMNDSLRWYSVIVWYQMQPISVYTNGTVFATETDITFVAETKETTLLEFTWYFGDETPVKTTSRNIKKKLSIPQWYQVTVMASNGVSSVVSEPHHIRLQRRIRANRLASITSALVNASVNFECRINAGTDVSYLWDFGDGTVALGNSSASHAYSREGEFTVQVLAFNNVSAASLRKHLFITLQPCQPPPIKNLGPGKVQVWRSQPVELGVTFEATVLCDISQGLSYSWSLRNSMGWPVPLAPAVSTHRQILVVPRYFLEPGNYTASAKVQVEGSIVHSNYSVEVEVRARAPVSVISGGTHLFISRTSVVILRGTQSYDPDYPEATLRYYWKCTATSTQKHPCFTTSSPHSLNTRTSTLTFTANSLSDSYDQFIVSLTVSSAGRNSSETRVFLSTHSDSALRFVHISQVNFKDIFVNWNEELSFQVECEDCSEITNLSYSWDLFLVNATKKNNIEVPFCRTVGLLESLRFGTISKILELTPLSVEQQRTDPSEMTMPYLRELSKTPGKSTLTDPERLSTEPLGSMHQTSVSSSTVAPNGSSWDNGPLSSQPSSRESSSLHLPDSEAFYSDIQEAIPSEGRRPGISLPESRPSVSAVEGHGGGDNLLGPIPTPSHAKSTLLVDWPKFLLPRTVFHDYTSSGIMEQDVIIKPYSLSPGETYVLQASVVSKHHLLGKAQLYLAVNQAPKDVSCQVQPSQGLEAQTIFSIFCMSGKPDFCYEFSYQIGNTSKHIMYHGRDAQYYFALPAGEPANNYKVLVSTVIIDGQGSQVQCAVEVTVLPYFHGTQCPEDLYNSSLKNLSTLQLMGNYLEIRNYIAMITRILSRWAKEDKISSCGQWSQIQDAFISSVCRLEFTKQEEMINSVLMLRDLIRFPNKLSFKTAVHILKYSRMLLTQNQYSARFAIDKRSMSELILLVTEVLEVSMEEKSRRVNSLREEGNKIISDLLLDCLCLNKGSDLYISTKQVKFHVLLHHEFQSPSQSLGSIQVHVPADKSTHCPSATEMESSFFISQLMLFKKNPYPEGQDPGQIGQVISFSQYNCSSRRPIHRQRLRNPLTVEFMEETDLENMRNKTTFILIQDKVNFHKLFGLSENPLESLQIRIEFSKPITSVFPVMLLVRYFEKPTPSDFLMKQIYLWDASIVHIYLPAVLQKGNNVGYLSLLDADYDRKLQHKYFAKAVNYSIRFHWIQCVFWDSSQWKSEEFPPQQGTSPDKVNCSYSHLAAFAISRRKVNASFEVSDISILQRHPENLLLSMIIVVFIILYAFLVIKSKQVDHHEKRKLGYIFLQENCPPDHQLYAVVIDTGFRTPARFTAKVYIVLYGESGLSEPKELYCPETPLFESNSRHTFILSVAPVLGTLQKIRLWHSSSGSSPAWFVSHVMVRELRTGQCWFFPAECWLSVSQWDGCVERELACLRWGLGFWRLFYSKCTEYLEDYHVWASVYSRPSCSRYLHTPRLTVASALLCTYMCLSALIIAVGHEQLWLNAGTTSGTWGYFRTGFLCSLLISPGAQLLSLLFRLSKKNPSADLSGSVGVQRRVTSHNDISHLPPELETSEANSDQWALREKSVHSALGSHSDTDPQVRLEALATPCCLRMSWLPLSSIAWTVCGIVSLVCGVATGFLGSRFGPAQCIQWSCLLTVSIFCCVLLTQPLMIGLMALSFAWKRKDDKHFFIESLHDATRYLDSELVGSPKTCTPLSSNCSVPNCASEAEQVLAARHRARCLRWAHPPSMAHLRVTRTRMRREMRARKALRDIYMHIIMLLLLLFIICGTFSQDEYFLNQAIRNEFTRVRHSIGGLRSMDDWWHWSLTTLLDGLYQENSSAVHTPGPRPMALGGKCYLIGTLVIKQMKVPPGSLCKLSSSFPMPLQDSFPTLNPRIRDPVILSMIDQEIQNVAGSYRDDCEFNLGSTRTATQETLLDLRARKWTDHGTRAVSIYFSLYNPPSQLFSSVSLTAEVLPTGRLTLSALVESFTIFHSNSSLQSYRTLLELLLLVLSLIQLCIELYDMIEKGVYSYWQKPRNWLELFVVGASLVYHITSSHCLTLTGEVMDQLHKGLFQGFVDLSHMASCNQRARWLQGIVSFLLILKFLCLLGIRETTAFMRLSLSFVVAPGLVCVLMLAAYFHLHGFLLFTKALTSGTFSESLYGQLFHFPGRSQRDSFLGSSIYDQHSRAWCYGKGALFILVIPVWFGMLRGSLMTLAQNRKYFQRKFLGLLKDVTAYIWGKVLTLIGKPKMEEMKVAENQNYFLDEFEDLLDELLLKINGLSDCLEFPLLEQQSEYILEASAEDIPLKCGNHNEIKQKGENMLPVQEHKDLQVLDF